MKETIENKDDLGDIMVDFENKGCLSFSLVLLVIVIASFLAVRYASFDDNMLFFLAGIGSAILLPLSGLIGIIRNSQFISRNPSKEVGPMIGFHILIFLIGFALCAYLMVEINSFRLG